MDWLVGRSVGWLVVSLETATTMSILRGAPGSQKLLGICEVHSTDTRQLLGEDLVGPSRMGSRHRRQRSVSQDPVCEAFTTKAWEGVPQALPWAAASSAGVKSLKC